MGQCSSSITEPEPAPSVFRNAARPVGKRATDATATTLEDIVDVLETLREECEKRYDSAFALPPSPAVDTYINELTASMRYMSMRLGLLSGSRNRNAPLTWESFYQADPELVKRVVAMRKALPGVDVAVQVASELPSSVGIPSATVAPQSSSSSVRAPITDAGSNSVSTTSAISAHDRHNTSSTSQSTIRQPTLESA